jgi:thiamine biosynthesis protein ThiI
MHKPEIIALAYKIGTRHFAENMPEYCGVISKNPVINGSFKRVAREASKFNFDVLDQAIEQSVSIPVNQVIDDVNKKASVEVIKEISNQTVIDIRQPEEMKRAPLSLDSTYLEIPIFELKTKFKKLDQKTNYLFYCDKGVMSQLHAQYLIDEGFENIKVYRP